MAESFKNPVLKAHYERLQHETSAATSATQEPPIVGGDLGIFRTNVNTVVSAAREVSSTLRHSTNITSMLTSLTFIGENEYKTAAHGIANMWRTYLDRDPKNQILLAGSMSGVYGKKKSDAYLFDEVMISFNEDEQEHYRDRIVVRPEDITTRPKHVKMIMLDDWSVSGAQLRRAYKLMRSDERYSPYLSNMEINLLVGTADRLKDGLAVEPKLANSKRIPVRAYYRAHHAPKAKEEHASHVTGLHSSVDYDFEKEIERMVLARNMHTGGDSINMPPLTNIVREYRYSPSGLSSDFRK